MTCGQHVATYQSQDARVRGDDSYCLERNPLA
jgi:hypothetical protein